MITYRYECDNCATATEINQVAGTMTQGPPGWIEIYRMHLCPTCGEAIRESASLALHNIAREIAMEGSSV